jgi:predicted GTPase
MANIFAKLFGNESKEKIKTLEASVEEKDAEIELFKQDISSRNEQIGSLSQNLEKERLISAEKDAEIEKLNKELFDLKTLLESAEEAGEKPGTVLDYLRSQIAEKEKLAVNLEDETKKQKKRIEDLEDDLENAEDEAKRNQKKLDEIKSERNMLQNEIERIKDEYGQIKNELTAAKQNLESTEKDLDVKKKSVNFVNEILNAKGASDDRTKDIYEKTEHIMNFVHDSICETFKEIYEDGKTVADIIGIEIWKWVNLQRKTWLKDKVVVAFIGEFSAGKTSIVNRIFTQDRQDAAFTLPTDRAATTAVPTYISYGGNTRIQFTDAVGELRELSKEVFLQFTKDSLENISVSRLITHFVTEYDNESLKRLSILDTPGFSSGDKEDEDRTTAVIQEADMLFWVVDANAGDINTRSIKIIKNHVGDTPLYVIINKVDSKAPSEREQIETKMRKTMEKIPIGGFIQFSQKEPLELLTDIINTVQPRRPNYDVIVDINDRLDDCIQHYKNSIGEIKKEINQYNRTINETESITGNAENNWEGSYSRNFASKKRQFDKNSERLSSEELIGSTLFGDGNKIKDVDLFWQIYNHGIDLANDMLRLSEEHGIALQNRIQAILTRSDFEQKMQEFKEKQKHLENLKRELNNKLKDLGVGLQKTADHIRSVEKPDETNTPPRYLSLNGDGDTCENCKYYADNWCGWNGCSADKNEAACNHKIVR